MNYEVQIFTQPNCSSCAKVKGWFQENRISYIEKDIVNDPQANQEFGALNEKFVPITIITADDKRHQVVGPNLKKIKTIVTATGISGQSH
ncbi:glutaredoxin family protein [Marinococcus halophilus]|uniref:Glutaredoxin domain-containing protein n=1 Tax=Marinococcus halophilus TaxID=1371 RepID=A0A510Y5A7_MARHA|nr:glutaredoxin domain-containing protein [Marinococcus halophilus]GEK58528.1 hypothetical protein MHA01_14330 [Marinococcus halophilus]